MEPEVLDFNIPLPSPLEHLETTLKSSAGLEDIASSGRVEGVKSFSRSNSLLRPSQMAPTELIDEKHDDVMK